MKLTQKTAPAIEPITIDEAKLHLRVDHGHENALITEMIGTARQLAEQETKRVFITQIWTMILDREKPIIEIPFPPLQSINSIKTISATETTVDETSAAAQKVLKVAATTGFKAAATVIINRGGIREEERTIDTIQDGISLTMTEVLTSEHTAAQADRVEIFTLVAKTKYIIDISPNSYSRLQLRTGYNWPIHRNFGSFIIEFTAGYGDAGSDIPAIILQGMKKLIAYLYENRGATQIPEGIIKFLRGKKIYRI